MLVSLAHAETVEADLALMAITNEVGTTEGHRENSAIRHRTEGCRHLSARLTSQWSGLRPRALFVLLETFFELLLLGARRNCLVMGM